MLRERTHHTAIGRGCAGPPGNGPFRRRAAIAREKPSAADNPRLVLQIATEEASILKARKFNRTPEFNNHRASRIDMYRNGRLLM